MATLQKIRSNKITQIAIGLGMLGFIATGAVEILQKHGPNTEVMSFNGESLDYADLNQMVEEYKDVLQSIGQLPQGQVSNEIMAQIREQVYQSYLMERLINEKCANLGITVTDTELQNVIKNGQHPLLTQTPFRNEQGGFDYAQLQQFIKQRDELMKNPQTTAEMREYADRLYSMWCFIEKEVKKSILAEKYQILAGKLMTSNPISAKASFDARTNEKDIVMAALPYTLIEDKDVNVDDKELDAKYNEYKSVFYRPFETRDIKFIDVNIQASKADEDALQKEMAGYAEALQAENANFESIVRQSQSLVSYSSMSVSKTLLPSDAAAQIDSMAVGTQTEPYYNAADNTINIVRLIAKNTRPDSVEIRQIALPNQDIAAAKKSADSIVTALKSGAEFDSIAKIYNQSGQKNWVTKDMYEGRKLQDDDKKFIENVTTAAVGEIKTIEQEGGVMVVNVTDRRQVSDKYDVAIIKRTIDFSNETATDYFNKLSTFVASNNSAEEMEKSSQKAGYAVTPITNLVSMTPQLANIADSREVIRWAFNEDRKVGDVSEIIYCGKNREHLVVAVLTAIEEEGYLTLKNEQVKAEVTRLVQQDKKAAKLQEQMKGAKSLEDVAKMKGAVQDTVQHITFAAPAFIMKVGAQEFAISGAATAAKVGDFVSGVRGEAGVYAFKVLSQNKTEETYDEKAEMENLANQNMGVIYRMFNTSVTDFRSIFYNDYKKADRKDSRHLFY